MEATVNLCGWVGTSIEVKETTKGAVLRFRVATTSRYQKDGVWVDGDTTWWTVNAWRALARNAGMSLRKGDPVMVAGRLRTECWTDKNGDVREDKVVEATAIGHDLSRGVTHFTKVRLEPEARGDEAGAVGLRVVGADEADDDLDEDLVDPVTGELTETGPRG